MKTLLVFLLFATLVVATTQAQNPPPPDEELWETLNKEPCLKPIIKANDYDRGILIYYLHRRHRFLYPLNYFCLNGRPLDLRTIERFFDRWTHILANTPPKPPPTLGIWFDMKHGLPFLLQVGEGSPAFKAGLRRGDFLIEVNGQHLSTAQKADQLLTVPEGETIRVAFWRQGERYETNISGSIFRLPPYQIIRFGSYIYLQISRLNRINQKVLNDLRRAYLDFPFNGLVIDLRGCPGGFVNDASTISGWFLGQKVGYLNTDLANATYLEERSTFPSDDQLLKEILAKIPLVVLVNGNTYSAAEMISGALKYHRRALLVGKRTGGKGTIGNDFLWTKGREITLSTALWYVPDGSNVEHRGLDPDIPPEKNPLIWQNFQNACEDGCDLLRQSSMQTALGLLDDMNKK